MVVATKRERIPSPAASEPADRGISGEGFVTVIEAADFLKVSRAKVYAMMDNLELAYAKFGKSRRIPWRALRELAEKSMVTP
jgi:excisionase family DNA binding protein